MSAPGKVNLTLAQGSTWAVDLTWQDDSGNPIDLTNYTARMQARDDYTSSTAILTLATGSGITLGGTAGTIGLSVGTATTASIGAARYVYDLELTSGSGVVTRLIEGMLTVTPEVTR